MHELSLAGNILEVVEHARARDPFTQVNLLRLQVGVLATVDVAALRFALESMASGTCLSGARIEIDETPASAWCSQCKQQVAVFSRLDLCPLCDGVCASPAGGTELKVLDLQVS